MTTASQWEQPRIVSARRRRLLAWFVRHGRDLPWRRRPTLYGTWIAETMLQQTTVAAVRQRWVDFLRRFPDVQALAAASESDVLAAWAGLGYYRRARLLHEAAQQLVAGNAGELPRDLAGWSALPGVGPYTAAAVVSIGRNVPVPVVDVNVRRVLLRWHYADAASAAAVRPSRLRELAAANLAAGRPGAWNQALMDLGAGPCGAVAPACARCPVRRWCAAGRAGTAAEVPPPARRQPVHPVVLSALVLESAGRMLWLPSELAIVAAVSGFGIPRRASLAGSLSGLHCLPMTPWYDGTSADAGSFATAWRAWLRRLGWRRPHVDVAGRHAHAITNHRLTVVVVVARWPDDLALPALATATWQSAVDPPPLATLTRRSLDVAATLRTRPDRDLSPRRPLEK